MPIYDMKQLSSSVYILPANLFARQEGTERKREACKSDEPICPLEAHVLDNRGFCSSNVCPGAAEPLTSSVRPGRRQAFPCGGFGTQRKVWMETWYVWNVWAFRSREQQMFLMTWERAPWNYKQVCRVTGSVILEAVAGIKTTILKHRQPHRVQQSEQQQQQKKKGKLSVMRSDTPVVWEWTSVEVPTGPIKTRGLGERQLHASKSTQPQKSCCLICVPLSPWQSETDNEEAPLLLLFCQKELEQSKRKGERRRWRCGELSQRHTRARTQNCEFVF